MKQKKLCNGSMTVEAVYVLPVIIFVMIALIYLSFYLYDKCRVQCILNEGLEQGIFWVKYEDNINENKINYGNLNENKINYEKLNDRGIFYFLNNDLKDKQYLIENFVREQLSKKLFLGQVETIRIEVTPFHIQGEVSVSFRIPFIEVKKYFGSSKISILRDSKVSIHRPSEFVRIYTAANTFLDQTEGMNKVKKQLKKLISFLGG